MVTGAGEQEGHDERIEGGKAECAEERQRYDAPCGDVRGETEKELGEEEECQAEAIESGLAGEAHQDGDENAAGEFGYPEAEGDGRGVESRVGADGVAGEPASQCVFDADVEEEGGAEDKERNGGQWHAPLYGGGSRCGAGRGCEVCWSRWSGLDAGRGDDDGGEGGDGQKGCGGKEEMLDAAGGQTSVRGQGMRWRRAPTRRSGWR